MSLDKHLNLLYSGTTPLSLGDRYYAQDLIRDLLYGWDNTGQTAKRLLGTFPALLAGGIVSKGADWTHIDITECWGVCNYSVEHPNTFAALPPSKTSSDIARLVHATAQTALNLAGLATPATLDGSTNYVKLRYSETNGNTRTRARAAGSYSYEVVPSYTFYCNTTAPNDYDVVLATLVGDGASYMTIAAYTPYNIKKVYDDLDVLERIYGTSTETIVATSATRTILDTDTVHTFFADCSQRAQTLVLPTLAANLGKIYTFQVATAGGWAMLDGEGAETINGAANFIMYVAGDHITVIGEASEWKILSAKSFYDTGFTQNSAWTNRHLGTITVVTKTADANLYTVGELITEETTGNTWRIDSITAGNPGAFVVRSISGTGTFTINKKLTGATSGVSTIQVNAATLNQDGNVTHNQLRGMHQVKRKMFITDTATDATLADLDGADGGASAWGYIWYGVSTSAYLFQTGASGIHTYAANGNWADWAGATTGYYRATSEVNV